MGLLERMSNIFKAKASSALDKAEDPAQTLDYSYQKQLELMQKVKQNLATVVTAKKRLQLQSGQLEQSLVTLDQQARTALQGGREDLARTALERKALIQSQLQGLDQQIAGLEDEQAKLTDAERELQAKVEAFRTRKEVIKAQYSAAEAQVKIGEAATGLSKEMSDVGMAVQRAEDKTDQMRARAAAVNELIDAGAIEDFSSPPGTTDLDRQIAKLTADQGVEAELAKMKGEIGTGEAASELPAGPPAAADPAPGEQAPGT